MRHNSKCNQCSCLQRSHPALDNPADIGHPIICGRGKKYSPLSVTQYPRRGPGVEWRRRYSAIGSVRSTPRSYSALLKHQFLH